MNHEQRRPSEEPPAEPQTDDLVAEPVPEKASRPFSAWLQNLQHRQGNRNRSHSRATQDRVKPLFLGIVGVAVVIVVLLGLLSTPISVKRQQQVADRRTPNLGRPQNTEAATADADKATRSVTPLLRAELQSERDLQRDVVTEKDLQSSPNKSGTTVISAAPAPLPVAPKPLPRPANLGQIEFSEGPHGKRESLAEVEARIARLEGRNQPNPGAVTEHQKSFDKASLVYVHSGNHQSVKGIGDAPAGVRTVVVNETAALGLPAGTRLLARLQSTITTAVTAPVVATVEVNYERDGEIVVPAGAKIFGKIEQANSSGHVNIGFDEIQTAEGRSWKIEGISQALDFGPLKGKVEGRKGMARFVTRAITGVGVVAAQAVGLRGGFNGPINNSVLIRDRLATNIAQAGEQHVQQLAVNTNLAVTVPASSRFYVVLRKGVVRDAEDHLGQKKPEGIDSTGDHAMTQAELRELRSLRQEFLRLMQLAGGSGHGAETNHRDR